LFISKKADCPLCRAKTKNGAYAIVSPWVRELGVKSLLSKYFFCKVCETGFFTKRYSELEMSKIYQDYRGTEYVRKRLKWEPWYTKAYNSSHDSDEYFFSRKHSLEKFLLSNNVTSSKVIVDVGGDRGQFIPEFGMEKIVIDISSKELIPGVRRVSSINESPNADLIIYAHTLEHVAEPISELEKLFEKSDQIYVEVPFGVPEISKFRKSFMRFCITLATILHPGLWARNAQPATGRIVSSRKTLTQSEHLTFFTEKSFQVIAEILGVNLVVEQNTMTTPDLSQGTVLQCLLTRRSVKPESDSL
jgi:hypothetical protein